MHKLFISTVFMGVLLSAGVAAATEIAGTVYEKDSGRKTVLFQIKRSEQRVGLEYSGRVVFLAPDNSEAVVEEFAMKDGKPVSFSIKQNQLHESGEMHVDGKKALFTYKDKKDDEDVTGNMVVPSAINEYVRLHWDAILKGETIKSRLVVLDRKETVGFNFFKVEDAKYDGQDVVVVKMKPTSPFISALVDPVLFTFSKDGTQLLRMIGRVPVRKSVEGKLENLDAEIAYRYL